jgi:hypothetical protein
VNIFGGSVAPFGLHNEEHGGLPIPASRVLEQLT